MIQTEQNPVVQVWSHRHEASKLRSPDGRQASSARGRLLLRTALAANGIDMPGAWLDCPALDLFRRLRERYDVGVSLAHCRGLVVVALARGRIGVDCEHPGRNRPWPDMAKTFFSADEADRFAKLPADGQKFAFLRQWTLKESMVKATSGSVFGDLNRLVVEQLEEPLRARTTEPGSWYAWHGRLKGCPTSLVCETPYRPQLKFYECRNLAVPEPGPDTPEYVAWQSVNKPRSWKLRPLRSSG